MDAAVVELDALADAVGATAQDQDLVAVAGPDPVRGVVGGVVVGGVLDPGHRHWLPGLDHADARPLGAELPLGDPQDPGQVAVGEAVLLGAAQQLVRQGLALVGQQLLLQVHQLLHLLQEIGLDEGLAVEVLDARPLAQGLVEDELALAGGIGQQGGQLLQGLVVEVGGEAQAVAPVLQGADGLLQGLLVGLADAHHLADGAHLGAQAVLGALELLEGPAGELDHHVVAGGAVAVEGAVPPVGDLVQGQAPGEQGGDVGDGEAGGLGGQGRAARGAGVDLDDDDAAVPGVVGELDVGAADDADGVDDGIGLGLEPLLHLGRHVEHGGAAEGVAGVHPQGVDVLDEADGDLLALGVAHHLQFQFLPALHRFLDQDLVHPAGGQAADDDGAELLQVVDQATAGAAHGVGGAHHAGDADCLHQALGFLQAVGDLAARHADAQGVHGVLEDLPVLAALDGVHLDANHAHAILFQDAGLGEFGGQVEGGLAAQVGQQGIGALLGDDPFQGRRVQGLDVGGIGHPGIGHDGGRVAVDQHDAIAEAAQGLAGLGAGVVEFAGLADDDGAGADDEDGMDGGVLGHGILRRGWQPTPGAGAEGG